MFLFFLNFLASFSWRGAVIDTYQASESTKGNKGDLHAIQEVLSKESGIFFTQFGLFNYQI